MIAPEAVSSGNLVKSYGRVRALDGFSLSVPRGAILGLVGPNGAGKTTWMMCVAGFLRPDSGEISLFGEGPFDAARHSGRFAILPQDSELPLDATPRSLYRSFARLQGLRGEEADQAAETALSAVNLSGCASKPVRTLSHGMRKRAMAGQCFLGDPELLMLDEPMNGLDPEETARLRDLILAGKGRRTVVISSHNLLDLERLCTHVAFVEAGRISRFAGMAEVLSGGSSLEEAYLGRGRSAGAAYPKVTESTAGF